MNSEVNNSGELLLPVTGMHCASCAYVIEQAVGKIKGVIKCEVNAGADTVRLNFDEQQTSLKDINQQLAPLGYNFMAPQPTHDSHQHSHRSNDNPHAGHDHSGANTSDEHKRQELQHLKRQLMWLVPVTILSIIQMLWEQLAANVSGFPEPIIPMQAWLVVSALLATVVLFNAGLPFLKELYVFVRYRLANMYTLVGLGTLTAYLASVVHLIQTVLWQTMEGTLFSNYFDVTIVVIVFVVIGRYAELRSKIATGGALAELAALQVQMAHVVHGEMVHDMPVEQLSVGNIMLVKAGEQIPTDGIIVDGQASINESMLTGESLPVHKQAGDSIYGGTINQDGVLKVEVTKLGVDTVLAQIIEMVRQAQSSKAPIERLADKISGVFVPAVLIIALITLAAWLLLASNFIDPATAQSLGLTTFVGVLVIACPCALGLATPTAVVVGVGHAARSGILVRDAASLEQLARIKYLLTDKTGTLTAGTPKVTKFIHINQAIPLDQILGIAQALEAGSTHPLAAAIKAYRNGEAAKFEIKNWQNLAGEGVSGDDYYLGNAALLQRLKIKLPDKIMTQLDANASVVWLANKTEVLAVWQLQDQLREGVSQSIAQLKQMGITTIMLTGDREAVAADIAKQVGIDQVYAELSPAAKLENLEQLHAKYPGQIAMVGDGINDAPALAKADVGIAMGSGTQVAISAAAVTLLHGDFGKVVAAFKLGRGSIRAIKQNLFWAFIYNVIGIPIAAGVLYPWGILLSPALAGLAMGLSSVSVVLNSLRLRFIKLS